MSKVKFMGYECNAVIKTYQDNGNTAIQLISDDGEPIARATVNLGHKLAKDKAYIKDYSENEGMLDALVDAGIVKQILTYDKTGYVCVPLCLLNLKKCITEGV